MQEIKVIIGASYGDEGKGLATDYFGAKAAAQTACHSAEKTAMMSSLLNTEKALYKKRPFPGCLSFPLLSTLHPESSMF